jgi:hypothetical protein
MTQNLYLGADLSSVVAAVTAYAQHPSRTAARACFLARWNSHRGSPAPLTG